MIEQRVPLRQRRELSRIIGDAFSLYVGNFGPLLSIAALVVPVGIAAAMVQSAADEPAVLAALSIPLALLQMVANLLATATLIAALADIDAGKRADFSRAYEVAFSRFWSLAGAILRVAFHVVLLAITIIGIPWAVQRAVRWLFIEQAVILDGTSAKAALSYSADAVIGSWWRTLGVAIVLGVVGTVPALLVTGVFSLAPPLVAGTVSAIVNAVVLPFGVTGMTLLYLDLKVRKESTAATSVAQGGTDDI
jgi:hypothetical protein